MPRKSAITLSSALICMLALLIGCSKKEEPRNSSEKTAPSQEAVSRKQTEVSVPENVKGKWKSVKLSIMDKETGKEGFVVIDIGSTMRVNGTNLVIKVENFLPQFVMDGTTLTSSSNLPKNPAVQVQVTENGKDVFKGWLFTLYPNTHASQHPRYGFGLIDFTPGK